ncbi:hypothetical protein M752DRAFT_68726 [Aspergillus phoenicis ATCC 13157]|uniref:Uncharacterized protein n=1 Tax=Aspergillus phoenicis ATCC 13157 TaxID=1353007 RepID=A0A370PXY9_ASPPH|nr:hypothetical protein M752DRAFT_68726 [Aspergillus phoenicis ATCC 13157]
MHDRQTMNILVDETITIGRRYKSLNFYTSGTCYIYYLYCSCLQEMLLQNRSEF